MEPSDGVLPEASGPKRKAVSPPEDRPAKRATPPAQATLEERRQELAEVYAAYDALFRAGPDGTAADANFLRLVQAGQGSDGCRRLAARFVPRFVRQFPQHCTPAAEVLISLASLSLSEPEQQAAARGQAAAGLAEVAAAARTAGAAGQQATIKLVDFCFKQLRHLISATQNGDLSNGDGGGADVSAHSGSVSSSGAIGGGSGSGLEERLWPCLDLCFTSHFRVVLAACLHALKNPAEPFYTVARQFIQQRLLAVPGPTAGACDGGGDAAMADASDSKDAAAGSAWLAAATKQQDQNQPPQQPLAAKALGSLQLKEQAWVRTHVEKWSKEVDATNSLEAFSLLEQLLQHLPAAPGTQAAGWLAASVMEVVKAEPQETAAAERGGGGAEQQPANQQQETGQQQQQQRRQQAQQSRSDRDTSSRSRSPDSDLQQQSMRRQTNNKALAPGSGRGRRRASPSPMPQRRRTPSPWRQQRQRSESPWRPQRQRSSSPWRRWSPGPPAEQRDSRPRGRDAGPSPSKRSRRSSDPLAVDGGELLSDSPRASLRLPPGFPQPIPSPCLASACLFFTGLPRNLEERELRAECAKHSKVECAVRPPNTHGCAFVTFSSVRDASRCYEAMCDALPWRDRGSPLQLTFVASQVYPPNAPQRPQRPPNHVWMAGVGSAGDEAEVLRCCKEGAIPAPEHLLKVPARRPGLLLVFRDTAVAEAAVAAIRAGRPRILGPPGAAVRPGMLPAAAPADSSPGPRLRGGPDSGRGVDGPRSGGAGGSAEGRDGRGADANGRDSGEQQGAQLPPGEYAGRTLWVGQIPPGVREETVVELFRKHGELAGHKYLRHTGCMFVDFATMPGATEARMRLDGYRFPGGCLRVEFKNENQFKGSARNPPPRERGGPAAGFGVREGPLPPAGPRSDGGRDSRHQQHPPLREGREAGRQQQPGSRERSVERGRQQGGRDHSMDRGRQQGGRSRSIERGPHGRSVERERQSGGRSRSIEQQGGRGRSPARGWDQQEQQGRGRDRGVPAMPPPLQQQQQQPALQERSREGEPWGRGSGTAQDRQPQQRAAQPAAPQQQQEQQTEQRRSRDAAPTRGHSPARGAAPVQQPPATPVTRALPAAAAAATAAPAPASGRKSGSRRWEPLLTDKEQQAQQQQQQEKASQQRQQQLPHMAAAAAPPAGPPAAPQAPAAAPGASPPYLPLHPSSSGGSGAAPPPRLHSHTSGAQLPAQGPAGLLPTGSGSLPLPPGIMLPPPPTLPPPLGHLRPPPTTLPTPFAGGLLPPPSLAPPPSFPRAVHLPPPPPPPAAKPPPPLLPPPPGLGVPAGRPPPPPMPPPPPAGHPSWKGTLTKSRAPVCAAMCLDPPQVAAGGGGGWAACEPQQWPAVLDVAHRADLQHVCFQMFTALRPEDRAVRRLAAADAAGRQALLDFSQYLRSKSRAGVVALPPVQPAGVQRTLYLVPPSEDVCRQLGVTWQTCTDCLLALLVPMALR